MYRVVREVSDVRGVLGGRGRGVATLAELVKLDRVEMTGQP